MCNFFFAKEIWQLNNRLIVRIGWRILCPNLHQLIALYLLIDADEPGKQVRSAIRIKNVSKSHVAFKVTNILSLQGCLRYIKG
jgi:hypothetical protein